MLLEEWNRREPLSSKPDLQACPWAFEFDAADASVVPGAEEFGAVQHQADAGRSVDCFRVADCGHAELGRDGQWADGEQTKS